jgi:hypothetical protein
MSAAEPEDRKSVNDVAAGQGIRIRRHCRPAASMEEIEAEMGAPRNILEKIIWDKEIEVAQVYAFICSVSHTYVWIGSYLTTMISHAYIWIGSYSTAMMAHHLKKIQLWSFHKSKYVYPLSDFKGLD